MLPGRHAHHHVIVQVVVEAMLVCDLRPQVKIMILVRGAHTCAQTHLVGKSLYRSLLVHCSRGGVCCLGIELHYELLLGLNHPVLLLPMALVISLESKLLLQLLGPGWLSIRTAQNIILVLLRLLVIVHDVNILLITCF